MEKSSKFSILQILDRLVQPHRAVLNQDEIRNTRLLSGMLIALIIFGSISAVSQLLSDPGFRSSFLGISVGLLVIVIAYTLSRTRFYRIAGSIAVLVPTFVVIFNIQFNPNDLMSIPFLVIGVLISSAILPPETTRYIALVNVFTAFSIPLFTPLTIAQIIGHVTFVTLGTVLITFLSNHRNLLEADRRAALTLSYDETLAGWSAAMEYRDHGTAGHSKRVTALGLLLARQVGLKDADLDDFQRGALLHDIGKIGISDLILLKADSLTDAERQIIQQHPQIAFDMLASIGFLKKALDIPLYHHERWDGSGYPFGLKAEAIPLHARVFAVADVWDALNSDRPYRRAWKQQNAIEFILENSGKRFDPIVVRAFTELMATREFKELYPPSV